MIFCRTTIFILFLTGGLVAQAQTGPPAIRLTVDDRPFLILGGEHRFEFALVDSLIDSGGKDSLWGVTGGMIIQTGEDEFLVAGTGFVARFSNTDTGKVTNIASCDEVSYVDGREVRRRRMNGDQDHQGRHVRFATEDWGIQTVRLYNSPRAIE